MFKKILQFILIPGFSILSANAQKLTPEEYISLYKDVAIREMKRMGIPASITLAQGLLETENGNSTLVLKSNNHFGIKCKSTWTSGGVSHDDDAPGECFRTYKSADDSYRDHSNFLRGSERYSFLFNLNATDYKAWAHGLKKAGYATNPQYPNILIRHIERYNLQQYSLAGAADVAKFESSKYKDDPIVFEKAETIKSDNQQDTEAPVHAVAFKAVDKSTSGFSSSSNNIQFINGSKCINAAKGTSLLAIATRYDISLHKLLDINELEDDGILEEDQLIYLQKKSKNGGKDFVIVQKKETLYDVAQRNGIQLESLLNYNQLEEDGDVYPATKLYLKPEGLSQQRKGKHQSPLIYQVQPKESLYAVSKKYSVSVQQLKEWNNLTSDELKIGQQLIVGK